MSTPSLSIPDCGQQALMAVDNIVYPHRTVDVNLPVSRKICISLNSIATLKATISLRIQIPS